MVLRGFSNKGSAVATAVLLHKTVVKQDVTLAFVPLKSCNNHWKHTSGEETLKSLPFTLFCSQTSNVASRDGSVDQSSGLHISVPRSEHILNGLQWHLIQIFLVPRGWILIIINILVTPNGSVVSFCLIVTDRREICGAQQLWQVLT